MSRKRNTKRSPSRRQRYYDDFDDDSYRPRRQPGGFLTPIFRFVQNVVMVLLFVMGAIVLVIFLFLIALHFATFVHILIYALYVVAGLAILGVLYAAARIFTAISHRISEASVARSKAKVERERVRMEKERVQQARNQVQLQQSEMRREEYAFYQKYAPGSEQSPRRTRVLHDETITPDQQDVGQTTSREVRRESPYRTRVLPQQADVREQPAHPELEPQEPKSELEELGMPKKGQIFSYRNYRHLLKPGQLIIGIRKDGTVRIGSWQDFKILLILGSSSSGKTTTTLEKCLCVVDEGGQLVVCDPGGFKPDSLIRRMAPLQGALMPGTSMAMEHADIMHNVSRFQQELERRRRGASMEVPILLVIDELNGLLMDKTIKKELTELIEKFGQQARGYNMYMILCAQRSSGLAAIRNSVISFICHKCPEMEAGKILPARYAKYTSQLGVGQTFVSDADGFIEPLQQTLITKKDLTERASTRLPSPYRQESEPEPPHVYGSASYKTKWTLAGPPSLVAPKNTTDDLAAKTTSDTIATWIDTILVPEPEEVQQVDHRARTEPLTPPISSVQPDQTEQTPPSVAQQKLDALARLRKGKQKS
jgi:hypothetical protein